MAAWAADADLQHYCSVCRKAATKRSCQGCQYAPPALSPANHFAWETYQQVKLCRTGDGTYMDSGAVLRVLALMALPDGEQLNLFDQIQMIESEFLSARAKQIENLRNGR